MSKSPRHRPGASPTLRTGASTRAHDSRLANRHFLLLAIVHKKCGACLDGVLQLANYGAPLWMAALVNFGDYLHNRRSSASVPVRPLPGEFVTQSVTQEGRVVTQKTSKLTDAQLVDG
jgi:hypothetical protein